MNTCELLKMGKLYKFVRKSAKPAIIIASFFVGCFCGIFCYETYKNVGHDHPQIGIPDSIGVKVDSTKLPLIFINTGGGKIERNHYISAQMKIVNNKEGVNYGDTIAFPDQLTDYDGCIAIRYRGNTSYTFSDKKGYAIRAIDKPISEGGKKKKSSFLGMRKGKKWALIAPHIDKSMIRNTLTFELARPFIDFVPQNRYVEVIIDGVYYGLFILMEQITADRIKLDKPTDDESGVTGGYLLQLDFKDKNGAIISKYSEKFPHIWDRYAYRYEYPDSNKLTQKQRDYIENLLKSMEDAIYKKKSGEVSKLIDIQSMIDYQIMTELSHNFDGYTLSTYMYKQRDDYDGGRFKWSLWDYDLAYGNYAQRGCSRVDDWTFRGLWLEMMKDTSYSECFKQSWKRYREKELSNKRIFHIIDSLTNILITYGAEKRNSEAWASMWHMDWTGPKRNGPQKYLSASYDEEITYLKWWIERRVQWMDEQLR